MYNRQNHHAGPNLLSSDQCPLYTIYEGGSSVSSARDSSSMHMITTTTANGGASCLPLFSQTLASTNTKSNADVLRQ